MPALVSTGCPNFRRAVPVAFNKSITRLRERSPNCVGSRKNALSETSPKAPFALTLCPRLRTMSAERKLPGHWIFVWEFKQKRRGESQPGHSRPSITSDRPISLTPHRIALTERSAMDEAADPAEEDVLRVLGEAPDHSSARARRIS